MSDVRWIQIVTDIFDDEKMVAIESLPDGYMIEIVWFKLLCLAGKCNENGYIVVTKDIPYTDEALAKNFRMDIGIVQRALSTFQRMNMIEVVDDFYMVSNWLKYQSANGLDRIRENGRERAKRWRDKQKAKRGIEDKQCNVTCNVTDTLQSNVTSSISISNNSNSLDKDISKEDDIHKDKHKEDIDTVLVYLNNKFGTKYKISAESVRSNIRARLEEGYTVDDCKKVIDTKYDDWWGTEMQQYLRPSTLFRPTKFPEYLNAVSNKNTKKSIVDDIQV